MQKKEKKTDIRNIRTTNAIIESFLALLRRNELGDITVNDICQGANISRGTFYRHYEDKYDLTRNIVDRMNEEISSCCDDGDLEGKIQLTLDYLEKYKPIMKNLIFCQMNTEVQDILHSSYANIIKKELEQRAINSEIPLEVSANYFAAGVSRLEMLWLKEKLKYTKEELSAYIGALVNASGAAS